MSLLPAAPRSLPVVLNCSFSHTVSYASEMCDVLNQDLFSACHEYLSPTPFHQQCRSGTCKCGTPCLCSALAHYAHHCRRFSVIIDFRSQIPDCGEYVLCCSSCRERKLRDSHCAVSLCSGHMS